MRIPFHKTICARCRSVNIHEYAGCSPTYRCTSPHTHKIDTETGEMKQFDYCSSNLFGRCWHYEPGIMEVGRRG
jgi:hypothetical protein